MKQPCVYIITNRRNGTLYTGVTSNLIQRIYQHKKKMVDGFSKKYSLDKLVWYEIHEVMESAIIKEKNIKAWQRKWKLELVEKENPDWNDLYNQILGVDQ